MPIANVVQRENYIYVYDENGMQTCAFAVPGINGPSDGLKSFTSTSINVQYGSYMFTYDERGMQTGTHPV